MDGVASVGYLLSGFLWSEWYRTRGDAWIRRALGRRLGLSVVWKQTEGRRGRFWIWGSADPVAPKLEARIGFMALTIWLFLMFAPPLILFGVHAGFGIPSLRTTCALLLISLPMAVLNLRGLNRCANAQASSECERIQESSHPGG